MKKHMPGFVPADFQKVGKILLPLGVIGINISLVSFLSHQLITSGYFAIASLTLTLIGLYLIYVVPKNP